MIELLTDNHYDTIIDIFDNTKERIMIISPFLSKCMANKLCDCVRNNHLECYFITRIYLEDLLSKVNSIEAIEMMIKAGIKVYAQKWLHTKLYLFDNNVGIIGSANFTSGGFGGNIELSLMASNESDLINQIENYCNLELDKLKNNGGEVTLEMLSEIKKDYQGFIDNKKNNMGNWNSKMYGSDTMHRRTPDLDQIKHEVTSGIGKDIMQDVFREISTEIKFDYNIWLKFDGEGNNRIDSTMHFPMTDVNYHGKKVYIQNYPFGVNAIKNGDTLFLAAVTTDSTGRNQPVIVGQADVIVYPGDKKVDPIWMKKYDWMERYPYYCIIDNIRILDTQVSNGIRLSELWDELGSDTYMCSFGKNEQIFEVAKKHYQKAHMRLSGNAKVFIEKRLSELGKNYGFLYYNSEK